MTTLARKQNLSGLRERSGEWQFRSLESEEEKRRRREADPRWETKGAGDGEAREFQIGYRVKQGRTVLVKVGGYRGVNS